MLKVPAFLADSNIWLRNMAFAINQLIDGKSNAIGSFTCNPNATSTTVTDLRVGTDSVILLMPTTAHASAEIGAGTIYSSTTKEGFTVTHANNAQTDKTFKYVAIG